MYLYCSTHTSLAAGELVLPLCPHQQLVFARSYPCQPNYILSFILGICLIVCLSSSATCFCQILSRQAKLYFIFYLGNLFVPIFTCFPFYMIIFLSGCPSFWLFTQWTQQEKSTMSIQLFFTIFCGYHHFEVLFGPIWEINAAAVYLMFSQTVFTAVHHTNPKNIIRIWIVYSFVYYNLMSIFVYSMHTFVHLFVYLFIWCFLKQPQTAHCTASYPPQKYHHNLKVYICLFICLLPTPKISS